MGNPVGYAYDELLAERAGDLTILDADHSYRWVSEYGSGERIGIILWHRAQDGQACGGICHTVERPKRAKWTIESLEPLTLSPSILCDGKYGCGGTHGYIRGGRWVSA